MTSNNLQGENYFHADTNHQQNRKHQLDFSNKVFVYQLQNIWDPFLI